MARVRGAAAFGALGLGLAAAPAPAQLVLDGSLGPAGEIARVGSEFSILDEHGVFSAGGENRYHSFSRFDLLNPNFDAVLRSDLLPQRVLIRVTGNRSRINAALRSEIPGADVYFFNPFGITFQRGGEIDVSGSFYASTADTVIFPEGPSADLPTGSTAVPALLSVNAPSAFGFTAAIPQDVIVEGRGLAVPPGRTLSFSGGRLEIRGLAGDDPNLLAPGADLQLAAVAGPAEIPVDLSGLDPASLPPPAAGCAAGCIRFDSNSGADASSPLDGSAPAGRIVIRAGRFEMESAAIAAVERGAPGAPTGGIDVAVNGAIVLTEDSEIASVGESAAPAPDVSLSAPLVEIEDSRVASEARSSGAGGDVAIEADTLRVSNAGNVAQGSFVLTSTLLESAGGGRGGDLTVDAERVELLSGGRLLARTEGSGDAGTLAVTATDTVRAEGLDAQARRSGLAVNALETATGIGGNLVLDTGVLEVEQGALLSATTFGEGDAGSIAITATERVTVRGGDRGLSSITAASTASGPGQSLGQSGNLVIAAPQVVIADGGAVSVSTQGTLDAGRLEIDADHVEIGGVDPVFGVGAGVFAQSNLQDPSGGDGGDIAIRTTGDIAVRDGGRVSVLTRGGGEAGTLRLDAGGRIRISDGGRVEALTFGGGVGGTLSLASAGGVSVRDGGEVSAVSTSSGDAGDIEIDAGPYLEIVRAAITTEAQNASGGRVEVAARDTVILQDARITTSVRDGTGGGGDVTIARPQFVLLDAGQIIAQADEGPGGNIRIATGTFLASPDSLVDASSFLGIDGEVVIESPNPELTGKLASLPQDYLNASELLGDACLARTTTEGSFVIQRARPPAPPDAPLSVDAGLPEACAPTGGTP